MTLSTADPAAMTADLDSFRARVRAWLASVDLPPPCVDYDERFEQSRAWHRQLFSAGFIGVQWPSAHGGQDLTERHQLVVTEELVRAGAPQPAGSIGLEVVGPTVLRYGTDEQRARFVRPMLSGEEIWCQGFSEPDAGSDLASLRTRGEVVGDELVITGQKVWTSWASHADWCAVLVRTDHEVAPHRGISYVLTDMRSPGLSVRPLVQLTGDAEFCELFFDEVRVPLANVLGGLGAGWALTMDTLGHERAQYAIRRRMENQLSFDTILRDLRATGEVRSDGDAERLGSLYCLLRGFQAMSADTTERLARGDVPSPLDSVDKLTLGVTEQALFGTALDLLGAARMSGARGTHGLDAPSVIKGYLYGRAASVYGGTAQIQRNLIAERLLGLPRSAR